MTVVRCPHCGAKSFTVTGWVDLDSCQKCGQPLGQRETPAIELEVRDLLYGHGNGPRKESKPESTEPESPQPET